MWDFMKLFLVSIGSIGLLIFVMYLIERGIIL